MKDETIQLSASSGQIEAEVIYQDEAYQAVYTAGTEVGEVILTAQTSNGKTASTSLTLQPRQLSIEDSSLSSDKPLVLADGQDQAQLRLTLIDQQGLPWPGQKVELVVSPAEDTFFLPYSETSNQKGQVTAQLQSLSKGEKVVQAKMGDQLLPYQVKLTLVSAQASNNQIKAVGSAIAGQSVAVTVVLKNEQGVPLPGQPVNLLINPSTGVSLPAEETVTNQQGEAEISFEATSAGVKVITAEVDGQVIEANKLVLITADAVAKLDLQAEQSTVKVGQNSRLWATFIDQFDNPLPVEAKQVKWQTSQAISTQVK